MTEKLSYKTAPHKLLSKLVSIYPEYNHPLSKPGIIAETSLDVLGMYREVLEYGIENYHESLGFKSFSIMTSSKRNNKIAQFSQLFNDIIIDFDARKFYLANKELQTELNNICDQCLQNIFTQCLDEYHLDKPEK